MAKKDQATEEQAQTAEAEAPKKGGGRAIVLSNGERRVDYIRRRHYIDGVTRSEIAKEVEELQDKPCPYQIVFAATKPETVVIDNVERTRPESAQAQARKTSSDADAEGETQGEGA